MGRSYFHLHLVSDATGETLIAVSRAVAAQYQGVASIEHIYPLVRTQAQLDKIIAEIRAAPGIVLFTLVDQALIDQLEEACRECGAPSLSVLQPISKVVLAPGEQGNVAFEPFFTHILMHELMHGLGPTFATVGGKKVTIRESLQELGSAQEEAKADISGLWALQFLVDKGVLPKELERTMSQRQQLEKEGVRFSTSGGVDLETYGWGAPLRPARRRAPRK